MQQFIKDDFST